LRQYAGEIAWREGSRRKPNGTLFMNAAGGALGSPVSQSWRGYWHRYRRNNEDWQDVEEPVAIVRTPCRFGGSRPWFVCPGVVDGIPCRRRVGKLYGPGRYFLCRHCYGLAYQSQREQAHDRALRRAVAIRRRLGGEPGMLCPFPEKPKGMHWRSYERLRQRAAKAEGAANEHLWMWLGRLKARRGNQRMAKGFWT
jgi:hypothetical protein